MNISYSRFSTYLRCPYSHYLRYVEHISSKDPVRPLHFGSDFHKLLEVRANKEQVKKEWNRIKDKFDSMPLNWQEELGENYPEDLKSIFIDYMQMWRDTPLPTKTEKPFEIQIGFDENGEKVNFIGVIDELYIYGDDIDIGEHKTFSRPPDMNTLVMNTQKSLYCKAVEILYGKLPKQVRWDYIRSTPAKYPIWLEKSQRFSNAKSRDITPSSWRRACKEHGITDKKVIEEGEERYKGNEGNFFFRVQQDIYPEMVNSIYDDFIYVCNDIVKRQYENKVRNLTKDCNWCVYRDICMTELSGGDRDYIIEQKYIKEKPKK